MLPKSDTPLFRLIKEMIQNKGPMCLSHYMSLCLSHPVYGFYRQKNVFGRDGHFITAPEISQIFGEIVGIWVVMQWISCKRPAFFNVVELGPGRGTLMQDLLQGTQNVPGFHEALSLTYIDLNITQKKAQQDAAAPYLTHNIQWAQTLAQGMHTLQSVPTFFIGNEYLDCLAINQEIYHQNQWYERCVGLCKNTLVFVYGAGSKQPYVQRKTNNTFKKTEGAIYEYAPTLPCELSKIGAFLHKTGGAVLFLDYGYHDATGQSTLQGLYQHQKVFPLRAPGEIDLTAFVDFSVVAHTLQSFHPKITCRTQKEFLHTYGLKERQDTLLPHAKNKEDFLNRTKRLLKMDDFFTLEGVFCG